MGKDMDRERDKVGTSDADFASVKAKLCRLASKLEESRERPKGDGDYWKDTLDRGHVGEGEGPEGRGRF